MLALEMFRPGASPTGKMLRTWDYMNHSVLELYNALYNMKNGRAMDIIKDFVDESEHYKIDMCSGKIAETGQPPPPRQNRQFPDMHPSHLPGPPLPHHMSSEKMYHHEQPNYYYTNPHRPIDRAPVENIWQNGQYAQTGASAAPNGQYYMKPADAPFLNPNMDTHCNKQLMSPDIDHRYRHMTTSDNQSTKSSTMKTMTLSAFNFLNSYPHEKIVSATNNFSDEYKRGEGAFGTVYFAKIDFSSFAVKRLKQKSEMGHDTEKFACSDYMKEIPALVRYRHQNIVTLLGYSYDGPLPCLLYEYCENGSLEDNLLCRDRRRPLDWPTRHMIVLGAAIGLNFLHRAQPDKPLIHGDIKSANILLGKDFIPKIGDFGLARHGPTGGKLYTIMKTTEAHGTLPYLPEEYRRNFKLSTKVDVYSFGVVLMEVLTGQRAFDEKREPRQHQYLNELVAHIKESNDQQQVTTDMLKDEKCPSWPWDLAGELLDISSECTEHKFRNRPEMESVVEKLNILNNKCRSRMAMKSMREGGYGSIGDPMMQSPMNSGVTIKPAGTEKKIATSNTYEHPDDEMKTKMNGNMSETQKLKHKLEGLHIAMPNGNTGALTNSGYGVNTEKISSWHKEGPCQSSDNSLSSSRLYSCGYSTEATPGSSVQTPSSVPTSHVYDSSMPTTGSSFNQNYSLAYPQRISYPAYGSPGMLQSGMDNFGHPQFPNAYDMQNVRVQYIPQHQSQSDTSSDLNQQQNDLKTPGSIPSINPFVPKYTDTDDSFIPDPSLTPGMQSPAGPQFLQHHMMVPPSQSHNFQQPQELKNGEMSVYQKAAVTEQNVPKENERFHSAPEKSDITSELQQPLSKERLNTAPEQSANITGISTSDNQQSLQSASMAHLSCTIGSSESDVRQPCSMPVSSDVSCEKSLGDVPQPLSLPIETKIPQPSNA
ncbi:uncharacterized protein [Antedon mediterranea]